MFVERGRLRVRVPNPHDGDIAVSLLREGLRVAEGSEPEWEAAR